jgi:hypothetical protein
MTVQPGLASREATARRSAALAPTCRGLNYYAVDRSVRDLPPLYMDEPLLAHLEPHLEELGELADGRLHDLSDQAERHPPILHSRDGYGRDEEWVEYHPAYRRWKGIAFGQYGMHAMCHRGGVLGWPTAMPPIAKYVFHYLFAQAEFGLLCPVNLTDGAISIALRFVEEVAGHLDNERFCRITAGKLYHAVTSALFIQEGLRLGTAGGDARRLLLVRFVLEHRLQEPNTLDLENQRWEDEATDLLLAEAPVPLSRAAALLVR